MKFAFFYYIFSLSYINYRHKMSKIFSKGKYPNLLYSLKASRASLVLKISARRQIFGVQSKQYRNKIIKNRYPNFSWLSGSKNMTWVFNYKQVL